MRGSAVIHVENNHEGIIPHTSDVIALLPVAHQAAAELESTFPSSALVPRTASPHLSPNLEDTSQGSLTYGYLHQQYIRAGHHKSTSAARSLRNLACRRARQTDVNGQRHMNSGLGQQFRTTDFMTAFRRGSVQPREPTVMVERLEVEVHRNGRIVPTSNGSYHILDTSEPESSSDLSAHSICVDDEIVRACCPLDRVSVAVNSVGRGSQLIDRAMERVDKTTSRSYSMNNCLNKSTHESRSFERDLDINAGDNGDAGLKNVSADRQAIQRDARVCWRPVYEDISESDSDVDSVKNTRISGMGKDYLFFTQHVNFDCNRPRNSLTRHRHSDPTDATQHKAKPLNKRRYSAPEDPGDSARKRKEKEEKQKKRHRRWSFNTESDMYQTDHGVSKKKLYLNRLLLSKDATIKSWNICIDIAHDEHTTEEFQFPELPLPRNIVVKGEKEGKEEKEAATITERDSSGIVDFARESSSLNEQTKSGYCSGSEIKQEINIEDEDNVAEESPVSVPEVRTPIPGSAHNKWMVRFPSGIRNVSGEDYEVPSGIRKSQLNEAGVDGKSSLHPLKIMEPLDCSLNDTSVATRVEKDKRVENVPYHLAKIMKIHGCSGCMHHRNANLASKQTKGPRGLPENLESNVCRNMDSDMAECASGENPDITPKNDKKSNRSADSLLPKAEEVNSACSTCAQTEKSLSLNNFDCNRNSEERGCRLHKEECCKSQPSKEAFFRNLGSHPPTSSLNMSAQEDVTMEQRIYKSFANTSNTKLHRESINDREVKENENYINDLDKERSICKNNVDQTDREHGACSEIESASEDVNDGGESRELTSGRRCSSPPKIAKKKRRKARSKKEPPGNNSITRKKSRGPRKQRFSRKNFRHDSIQTFKASTAFPPHNTLVPWRYKCNKPELLDPLNSDSINLPSPVLKPIPTETQFDGRVTNIEIQDDIPSPASLTIDLEEQNTNASETSNLDEGERSRRRSNSDAIGADGDPVTSVTLGRRMSCEECLPALDEKVSQAASPENQSGGIDSESSDEGQSKKRRKRVKKKKSDDTSVVDVKQNVLTAQMQEKGRRLAQELPGFNWLEEKIRNGGVTTVLPRKRLSVASYSRSNGGSVVDTSNTGMRETPTSEAIKNIQSHVPKSVSDAARSSVLPPSSSLSEYRHSKRLQEYLLRPPKRARHVSPAEASELGSQRQEVVPPLRPPTHEHAEEPSVPPASAPVPSLQRTQFAQQKSPRPVQPPSTVPDREHSPHLLHQSSRRPVIVSASELAKNSDVSPLIQQLTSGGELEVTLSTPPTSSSASSDSGVGTSSHRTSSDAEQSEVMHVSIKPVHAAVTSAGKGLQCPEERPRDAEQCTSFRRMSYCVEQLSQPLHPESGSVLPRDPAPPYVYNRELPRWHGVSDLPARKVEESTSGHPETLPSAPPYGNPDKAYSDRIATMARHAATSFDTGFGMGVAVSQEACHRVPRHTQQRPFDLTHQPASYHRENMLKTSGYIPPLAPQPGTFNSRLPQHGLFQPSYMIPQQPIKPQVVRPSAQYPAGMGPCRPSPTYLQTLTAVNSSQGLMPGIAQCSNNLIAPQSSTFSPHSPRREMNSTILSTNRQVPSPLISPVQEKAPEAPQVLSQNYNHAQISGLWSEAQASGPENQTDTSVPRNETECFNHHTKAQGSNPENRVKSSDPLTKEKNPPKDIEEIRKAAEAAAEELEKLEQLKQTTRMNLQRLKLAEEQAIEELARKQKHTEEAVEVNKAGKTVQPRPAVPSATAAATINSTPKFQEELPLFAHERHQIPVIQDNNQSAQRPSDNADDNGSSTQELQIKLPSVTQQNQKPPSASEKHESGATCDNHLSEDMYENHKLCVPQNSFQPGVTLLIKQSAAAHESHQSGVAYENPPSGDAPENLQSSVTHENHQLGASSKTQKSADVCENCRSGAGCKNQQTSGACETHQLEVECENKESALAHEYHQTGFTHKMDLIKQNSSIASNGTGNAIPRSNKMFPAFVQVNQECGATCKHKQLETTSENHETQERVKISSDSTRSSVSGLTVALSAAVQENGQSDVVHENSQTQPIPCSSNTAESSMPELHTTIPVAVRENNLAQQKLDVSSNSIGKSVLGLNETFPAVAHKNQQSDTACRNHKTQEEQNVTSDSTGNSIPSLNVTFPAAALVNQQPELENKNQQPEIAPRNHKMQQKVDITADNAGNSVSGLNVTFPAVVLVNKESGVEGKNGQPGVACEHYKSAVPCETHQFAQRPSTIIDTTRNSIPGLHMTYPKVSYENHQSEQRLNATIATTKNSVPALLTSHRTVGHQNREPIQRPLSPPPPPPLPARSPIPVPVSLPQRPSPVQTLPMSHHITLSQSQPVPYLQTHTVVLHPHHASIKQSPQHSHTVTAVHPPLPQLHPKLFAVPLTSVHPQFSYMPRPTLYPQLPPMPQAALHSPSLSQISPRFQLLPNSQASPHSRSLPASQASQYSQSLTKSQRDPHSQSLPVSQIFPHSQVLPLSQASQNSQPLPLPQISPHSQSLPISQALPHSHSLPVSQTSPHSRSLQLSRASVHPHLSPVSPVCPHSQSLQLSQTSARSQPGSASQPLHQQRLKVPLHSPSGTQPFQVLSDQQRSAENIPQPSLVQKEAMPPPTLIRQRVLPKSPQLVGSHIPVSVHSTSRCTSHQTASVTTTVYSRQSDPYVSVIPRGGVLQQPSVISQEPHVAITSSSASLSLPSSTVEECPIDLSICKRKSLSEDKEKSPSSVTSTVVQLDMNDEQNVAGLSSSSPKHHQRTQDQPSDILNPTPEECSVTNHSGMLHRDQKISQSHVSQHVPTENLRHQEQIQASETGNKRKIPSHVTSVSTANLATENYRLGMKPSIHPVTVAGSTDGKIRFETPHDQNMDDSVMHRQRVHVSTHHDTMHNSQYPVCSAHGPVPRSAYIPVYHETVFHGLQSEEQQRAHIAGLHTADVVASDRDRYWSADKQIPPTATLTPNSLTVEGDHYQRQSRLVCGRCCGTARFMCSACHNQWYCSSYCQMRHWRSHSLSCRRPTTE